VPTNSRGFDNTYRIGLGAILTCDYYSKHHIKLWLGLKCRHEVTWIPIQPE